MDGEEGEAVAEVDVAVPVLDAVVAAVVDADDTAWAKTAGANNIAAAGRRRRKRIVPCRVG